MAKAVSNWTVWLWRSKKKVAIVKTMPDKARDARMNCRIIKQSNKQERVKLSKQAYD